MALNKDLYSSSSSVIDAGMIYDQTEATTQDEINANLASSIIISDTQPTDESNKLWVKESSDSEGISIPTMGDISAIQTSLNQLETTEVIVVNIASYSGSQVRVPASGTNSAITADHVVLASTIGTPSNQTGDWTVNTYAGYLTLSGSASAATSVKLVLGKAGTTI